MPRRHSYSTALAWTGNTGEGTRTYKAYARDHTIVADGKPPLLASSDPLFRGDSKRYNPEELLVASLSSCHMLWYLHLCADAGVEVIEYSDHAVGEMVEGPSGGEFVEVRLRPRVMIAAGSSGELARALHEAAHEHCFITRSVKFPVLCEPLVEVSSEPSAAS